MKRLLSLFASILLLALSIMPAGLAFADSSNLIANASLETVSGSDASQPNSWYQGGWGTNTATLSYANNGHTGARSARVDVTSYTSGDAKWYFAPVAVTGGAQYSFSDYYQSNVTTSIVAQFDDGTGKMTYQDLVSPAAAATWSQSSAQFTAPAAAKYVTIFHLINQVGWLQTDDFSLSGYTAPAAPTVTIASPVANSTVSGQVSVTATPSDASKIAGVQFTVDGTSVGSEATAAPYATNCDTTTVINGLHSIAAVARSTSGQTTTSAPVQVTVANPTSGTTNMIPNPSMETVDPANAKLPQYWGKGGWGTNTATLSYLATGHTGTRSLKAQITSYTNGSAYWYFQERNVTGGQMYNFSDYYKSNVVSDVEAGVTMSDGSIRYIYLGSPSPSSSGWTKFETQFTMPVGAVSATLYHSINSVGNLTVDDYSLTNFAYQGFNRPVVTLTFDDGYATSFTNALPLLNKYGMKSTNYIITSMIGTDDGYMTKAQLKQMYASGQEIGSHTVTHPDLTTLSATRMDTELKKSQASLKTWLGAGAPINNFASPYGAYNQQVVTDAKKYYGSYRGVQAGYNAKNNFDKYNIRVQNMVSSTSLAEVQSWVQNAQATNTWLVLVYHQVDPSTDSGEYNTYPSDFEAQLAYIKSTGITVETMSQALAELTAQL